jgi:drug/metabolite transporter (DMT)-like permease
VEIVLALGAAIAYGVSDFTGGVFTKRARVFAVILVSQLVSLTILILVIPFWSGSFSWAAVNWGAGAGVAALAGASLLYRGLAIGRMGVVAPITAILAAAIPVAFGLSVGERPAPVAFIGVVIGLVAVVLISSAPEKKHSDSAIESPSTAASIRSVGPGVIEAFGAGVGFGLFFILLERAPQASGLWPLAGTRLSEIVFAGLLVAGTSGSIRSVRGMGPGLLWLGFINLTADLLFLLATRGGLLSLVAVVTSLYPAATVALARVLLKERMVRQQLVGVACAALSVSLIALR